MEQMTAEDLALGILRVPRTQPKDLKEAVSFYRARALEVLS
jgi:hypothetical protein